MLSELEKSFWRSSSDTHAWTYYGNRCLMIRLLKRVIAKTLGDPHPDRLWSNVERELA